MIAREDVQRGLRGRASPRHEAQRISGRKRGRVIADPTLLPYYLNLTQVTALCQLSPGTIQHYCHDGIWLRGQQWIQPQRNRRYLRDGVIAWMEERHERSPSSTMPQCRVNLDRSPELAAILEREAKHGV
jgi:hypothetical protein